MIDQSEAGGAPIITLTHNLDLTAAAPLAETLRAAIGQPIHIQANNVERLGAQCLQVLLSAAKTWASDDLPFTLSDISPAFQDGLDTFGITADTFSKQESS